MSDLKFYTHASWLVLSFIIIYVAVELVFNFRLIEVSNNPFPVQGELESVELFGRALSSFGICLLLWSFMMKTKWYARKSIFVIGVLPFIAFSVFNGQRVLIDNYVDMATTEQKQRAFLSFIASNIANYSTGLTGFTSESNTKKAVLPALIYFGWYGSYETDDLTTIVKSESKLHLFESINNAGLLNQKRMYDDFIEEKGILKEKYMRYIDSGKQYSKLLAELNESLSISKASIDMVYEDLNTRWKGVQSIRYELDTNGKQALSGKLGDLEYAAKYYYSYMKAPDSERYLAKFQREYENAVLGTVLSGTELKYWLPKDGSKPPSQFKNPNYYYDKLQYVVAMSKFGNPNFPQNFSEFLNTSAIRVGILKLVEKIGLDLTISNLSKESLYRQLTHKFLKAKTDLINMYGGNDFRSLTFEQFLKSSNFADTDFDGDASAYLAKTFVEFTSNSLNAVAKHSSQKMLNMLSIIDSPKKWTPEVELAAKNNLRALLVVFIAISLSGALIALMIGKLIGSYLKVFSIVNTHKTELNVQILVTSSLLIFIPVFTSYMNGHSYIESIFMIQDAYQYLGSKINFDLGLR